MNFLGTNEPPIFALYLVDRGNTISSIRADDLSTLRIRPTVGQIYQLIAKQHTVALYVPGYAIVDYDILCQALPTVCYFAD